MTAGGEHEGPGIDGGELAAGLEEARTHLTEGRPDRAESLLSELLRRHPDSAEAWDELGRARNNLRRLPAAEAAFREALRHDDRRASAWNHLGHVLRATNRPEEALEAFARAVELAPTDRRARHNLAGSFLTRGDTDRAIGLLQALIEDDPADAGARIRLAQALQSRDETEAAAREYRRALELAPGSADAAAGLGGLHQGARNYAAAGRRFREALAAEPGHPVAAPGLAAVLEIEGRPAEGYAVIEPMLAGSPPAGLAATGARLLRRLGRSREAMALLDAARVDRRSPVDEALLDFGRGDLLDDWGEYRRAFEHYRRANERLDTSFDPAGFRRTVDRLVAFFTPARLASLPRSGATSSAPVFIVGMPRSGTTLVEQILAAHSGVRADGERTALFEYVREFSGGDPESNWPETLTGVTSARLTALAERYLAGVETAGVELITDKMPANFLNLGLAELLLPRARVVYCRRDPMDAGLSCYRQNFRSGGMAFARRLEHIALYQQACLRLMDHWQNVSGLPIHVIDYEALVTDFEGGARALLAFLGLPWEAACLRPDRHRRVVVTASYEQVRRPVYTTSVGRWRDYEDELAPLRSALESPWSR
jgi:tetratricopeptide (TPR) repeat protein